MPQARHVGSAGATSRRAVLAGGAGVAAASLAAALSRHAHAQDGTPAVSATAGPAALPARRATRPGPDRRRAGWAGSWSPAPWPASPSRGAAPGVSAQGIADLRTAAPITADDHFRIASVSKTFTATVVLQLVDEGRLALDDTLEQYVPGIPNGSEITIRQVLQMTAGIFDFSLDEQVVAAYDRDPTMPCSPRRTSSPSSSGTGRTSPPAPRSATPTRTTSCSAWSSSR